MPTPEEDVPPSLEEQEAAEALMQVSEGSLCLASLSDPSPGARSATTATATGEVPLAADDRSGHVWRNYDGQRGSGRCCERCLMCQDTACQVTWRISPALPPLAPGETPSAARLLMLWRTELERCTGAADGCIAGGAHEWVDASETELRLTGPGMCCRRCGLVRDSAKPGVGQLKQRTLVLPNMLGQFGPAIRSLKAYRGDFKASALMPR